MNYSIDKDSNRTLTFALYILYIVAIFSAGLLAVVALIINYVKRRDVRVSSLKAILPGRSAVSGGICSGISSPLFHFSFCSLPAKILTCLQGSHLVHPLSV